MATKRLTSGSAPSTPDRSRADARRIAGDGFAAMADRPFADRRGTAVGTNGDEALEVAPALRRADTDAKIQGVTGGRSAPLPDSVLNTESAGSQRLTVSGASVDRKRAPERRAVAMCGHAGPVYDEPVLSVDTVKVAAMFPCGRKQHPDAG